MQVIGPNSVNLPHCDEEALSPHVASWIDVPDIDVIARREVILSAKVYIPAVLARSFLREMSHDWFFHNSSHEQ